MTNDQLEITKKLMKNYRWLVYDLAVLGGNRLEKYLTEEEMKELAAYTDDPVHELEKAVEALKVVPRGDTYYRIIKEYYMDPELKKMRQIANGSEDINDTQQGYAYKTQALTIIGGYLFDPAKKKEN